MPIIDQEAIEMAFIMIALSGNNLELYIDVSVQSLHKTSYPLISNLCFLGAILSHGTESRFLSDNVAWTYHESRMLYEGADTHDASPNPFFSVEAIWTCIVLMLLSTGQRRSQGFC